MSYKSKAAATADRACLARLHAALNAAHNAARLDECRLWAVNVMSAHPDDLTSDSELLLEFAPAALDDEVA